MGNEASEDVSKSQPVSTISKDVWFLSFYKEEAQTKNVGIFLTCAQRLFITGCSTVHYILDSTKRPPKPLQQRHFLSIGSSLLSKNQFLSL